MHYYLALIVLGVCCLFVNIQAQTNATVRPIVLNATVIIVNTTVVETTSVPTTQNIVTTHTTISPTEVPKLNSTDPGNDYVEPPPNPRGYCIRSTSFCSKIRPCCNGPCNTLKRRCP